MKTLYTASHPKVLERIVYHDEYKHPIMHCQRLWEKRRYHEIMLVTLQVPTRVTGGGSTFGAEQSGDT